jgi:hypothetical protein
MINNSLAARDIAVVGVADPATVTNTEVFTDVIDMTQFGQVMGIALLGNMANETIDFKAYTCAANGTSKVALKSATQLAASASANDNTQVVINVRSDDLTGGERYIVFGLVTGNTSGGPAAVVALGTAARYRPASDYDLASVVQVKV